MMSRGKSITTWTFALFALAAFFGSSSAIAQQLTISPTHIVLDAEQPSAELKLKNRGNTAGTYRVVLTHMRMTEDGALVDVDDDEAGEHGLRFADDLVRFAPRQVHLPPGATQRIRVMLRRPKGLQAGEYRTRMGFQAIPTAERATAESNQVQNKQLQIQLRAITSVTIPLFVRHGKLNARARLEDLQLKDQAPAAQARRFAGKPVKWLSMNLGRSGSRSIRGSIVVLWVSKEGARPVMVGKLDSVAVYTEVQRRKVTLPVLAPEGKSLDTGKLVVGFRPTGSKRLTAQEVISLD